MLLVIGYRRFVQKRPITGPEALKFPQRGFGIERFRDRHQKLENIVRDAQDARVERDVDSNLRKLAELRDAGILTDEEFEEKKARLQAGT
jgi:hypothetical protein